MSSVVANPIFRNLLRGVLVWAPLWIGTTVVFGAIGVFYILFLKQDLFLASQAILVRDEANGAVMRLGRFQSQAEMKAAQETILEMAKSHQVVREALEIVGPEPPSFSLPWSSPAPYPSSRTVEDTAKSGISIHAPKGTEFGVTEIIYIDVTSSSQERALAINQALCDGLEKRLQQIRLVRADGVIAELLHARDAAHAELTTATDALHSMERDAGTDLSDLRGMTDMIAGGSSARLEYDQIKNELRQTEQMLHQLQSDRELLVKAIEDPASFVFAPSALLNSQPGLKRFREGLVDAQLNGSQLSGKFTEQHPLVIASNTAQDTIIQRFSRELRASLQSVEADITVAERKKDRLENQRLQLEARLSELADNRAKYANVAADVKSRTSILDAAERALAEATAARDSSKSTSLLTRLDAPIVSDKPLGPGRTTLAGVCAAAGMAFGLGIVFLITPIDAGPTFGRRISDRFYGRRSTDITSSNGKPEGIERRAGNRTAGRATDPVPVPVPANANASLETIANGSPPSVWFEHWSTDSPNVQSGIYRWSPSGSMQSPSHVDQAIQEVIATTANSEGIVTTPSPTGIVTTPSPAGIVTTPRSAGTSSSAPTSGIDRREELRRRIQEAESKFTSGSSSSGIPGTSSSGASASFSDPTFSEARLQPRYVGNSGSHSTHP